MSGQMKGLNQFISEMRLLRSPEAEQKRVSEELANIRQRFCDGSSVSDYDCRKYVAKLLYIYMLGYSVQVGKSEALELASSTKFASKQMGYLALSLMYNESETTLEQVASIVTEDLASLSDVVTSLALGYLGSLNDSQRISSTISEDVYKVLVSPTSNQASKKRAALVLRHMFVQDASCIDPEWVDRIVALLDSPKVGVAISVSALVKVLASEVPELCGQVVPIAIRRLDAIHRLNELSSDEIYHGIAAPWLSIKLLELIDVLRPELSDEVLSTKLQNTLCYLIEMTSKNSPQETDASRNMKLAIFFESTSVYAHVVKSTDILKKLALPTLAKLCREGNPSAKCMSLKALKQIDNPALTECLLADVLAMVKNRDVSIRLQSIETLHYLASSENVEKIAAELLDCLSIVDAAVKTEMVLVIAAIVEKFGANAKWYVDTMLSLLYVGGKSVTRAVSQRLVGIISNCPDAIQVHATKACLEYLQSGNESENIFITACHLLGEYGALISQESGCSYNDQLLALQDSVGSVPVGSQGTLLPTLLKIAAYGGPSLKDSVRGIVSGYMSSASYDIHDRACESYVLLLPENETLLFAACKPMPPFSIEGNELVPSALTSKTEHVRQTLDLSRKASTLRRQLGVNSSESSLRTQTRPSRRDSKAEVLSATRPVPRVASLRPAILHREASAISAVSQHSWVGTPISYSPEVGSRSAAILSSPTSSSALAPKSPNIPTGSILTSNWEHGFRHLLTNSQGILFQDGLLQIGCQYEFRQHLGCLFLYLRNIAEYSLTSISCSINCSSGESGLAASCKNMPSSRLKPGEVSEVVILCDMKSPFAISPTIRVSYIVGSFTPITLKLPIVVERFMEPIQLSLDDWLIRWNQVGSNGEHSKTFKNFSTSKSRALVDDDEAIAKGLNYGIVLKPSQIRNKTTYGASMLRSNQPSGGNYGCLIKVEPTPDRRSITVTIRATKQTIAVILCKNFSDAYQL